ncbi:hypothetical protein QR680_000718 [Steinernema hermaphroditum]|uniref:Aldehyde dehydrogenase domain-containing protein n=1 Tax=Steinernema hermaphroditum TaxID=289476 RepID=A0AA39GVM6_9BILA|nr:hypothetical protein QR680_000718 [Steinernema hermaphroditum]
MENVSCALDFLLHEPTDQTRTISNFINGKFVETTQNLESVNPATGEAWLKIPRSNANDVDRAVTAAHHAFAEWSSTSVQHRSRLLNKVADLVEKHLDDFARLESKDQGKPIYLAKAIDIPRCVHNFRFFATAILHHTNPSIIQKEPVEAVNYVKNDPVGVAGLISPWNLPLYLLSFKLAPALACGNTVVCKPSEITSATAWVLMHAFVEAGFPAGVVNMVIGTGPEAGEPLVNDPRVPLISFTGSTVVGKKIAALAAPLNKKVSLEMGGKNACIVFPSVDLDEVVPTITRSCFINQGEICLCSSRLYVHREIFDDFCTKLVEKAHEMTVGDPEENKTLGALVSDIHYKKVTSYIDIAKDENCTILCGGVPEIEGKCSNGYFVSPTVVVDVKEESRLLNEEIFGPIVCVVPFDTRDEVIEKANSVPYGLSASVWSKNVDEVHSVAGALRVGTVWCNCWLVRELNMPFGGTKDSGLGREGAADSIHFFTEQKTICVKIN